jgi:hypothetical protein
MLVNILNDETNPIMEGLKIFTIEIKPVINESNTFNVNNSACNLINPNFINIVIEDIFEDCKFIYFIS